MVGSSNESVPGMAIESIGYDYIPISGYASHCKTQVSMAKPPVRKMRKPQSTALVVFQFAF